MIALKFNFTSKLDKSLKDYDTTPDVAPDVPEVTTASIPCSSSAI
jgi:hypothetical protein